MTKVTIVAENPGSPNPTFRASSQECESVGRTAGAALDELTRQMGDSASGMFVVVQDFRADRFFTAAQQIRLKDLLTTWRAARSAGLQMKPDEMAELEELVGVELRASAQRSETIVGDQQS